VTPRCCPRPGLLADYQHQRARLRFVATDTAVHLAVDPQAAAESQITIEAGISANQTVNATLRRTALALTEHESSFLERQCPPCAKLAVLQYARFDIFQRGPRRHRKKPLNTLMVLDFEAMLC